MSNTLQDTVAGAVSGTISGLSNAGALQLTRGKNGAPQSFVIDGPVPLKDALGASFNPSENYLIDGQVVSGDTVVSPGARVFALSPVTAG